MGGNNWTFYRDNVYKMLDWLKEEGAVSGWTISRPGNGINAHIWGKHGDVYHSGSWEGLYWIVRGIQMGYRAGKSKCNSKKTSSKRKAAKKRKR